MDHRSADEGEGVLSGRQGIALLDHELLLILQLREELIQEGEGLHAADQRDVGEGTNDVGDLRAVIRLHVQDHQVLGLSAGKHRIEILPVLLRDGDIGGIKQGDLLIEDHVAVVGDAVREREQVFKEFKSAVGRADPDGILCNLTCKNHSVTSKKYKEIELPVFPSKSITCESKGWRTRAAVYPNFSADRPLQVLE